MQKRTYFAVFEPSSDGGYGVYFPDFLGCITYGKDFETALKMSKEAIELHYYGMEKDGDDIPEPTSPNNIVVDEETEQGYVIAPVTFFPDLVKNELDNKAIKTNVTIPAWLKEMAEAEGVNFSQILQNGLKEYLQLETK